MKLAFKRRFGFGFNEKEVPVILNIGTLEAVCKELKIDFWQIKDYIKDFDFSVELLYQGYLSACCELLKQGRKREIRFPLYDRGKAIIWHEHMSQSSQKEFLNMMQVLFGEIEKATVKKKTGKNLRK